MDWYNILITVESYLKGYPVFLSDDGILRDAAGVHASYRPGNATSPAVEAILKGITDLKLKSLYLYLDSPISFSGKMASDLRERIISLLTIPFEVAALPSADFSLKSFTGIVASSDSAIMDKENLPEIFDLSRYVLERSFRFQAITLAQLRL
ncbi:hypothetical protein ES703_98706 [subsurface metagenome]